MKTQMYAVGENVWFKAESPMYGSGVIIEACAPDSRSHEPIYKLYFQDENQGWYSHSELTNVGPKHKHADLMLQYAKESFTDQEAYKQWQFSRDAGDTWVQLDQAPVWATSVMYRRKPVVSYKPEKETIEFVKPIKNVNDLIGIDTIFVVEMNVNQQTYKSTTNITKVNIYWMVPYDINHLIQNNPTFTSKEHAVMFMDAYDKMKQYMR